MNEFLPPVEMSLASASETLLGALPIASDATRAAARTYYDTFDGLLHSAGLELVREGDRLSLTEIESGYVIAAIPAPVFDDSLFASELPDGPLRDALSSICGVRAVLTLVRVRTRFQPLRVLDDESKTVVRLSLEEPTVLGSATHIPLRPRVRVMAVRGYEDELQTIHRRLERELGFKRAERRLVEEAVSATGGTPGGVSSRVKVPLAYDERADEAVKRVLQRLLEVIEANLEGSVADIDSEFLHDLRVSVRRSRAVQREMSKVFPRADLAAFRSEFRWLQAATGESRDLDVHVLEFEQYRAIVPEPLQADLDPLRDVLRHRRAEAHAELRRVLLGERTGRLLANWGRFLRLVVSLPADDRPACTTAIGVLAGSRIAKVYRRMIRLGAAIEYASPAEDLHELRKQGKELRYLLELFALPLFPDEVVKPMIRALKALQDVLGRHQDREVQIATLRSLGEGVAVRPNGPAAVMAMGVLVERMRDDEEAARAAFHDRFAVFSSESQRRLVKETFR